MNKTPRKKNIKVAIIGCGRIAGHHIQSIYKTKGIDIVAVSDLIEETIWSQLQKKE